MDPASTHDHLTRPISRPNNGALDAQPKLRRGSGYQESLHSDRPRRHSLDSGMQLFSYLHSSSYQEPLNSEPQRGYSLEIGTHSRHPRRRSFQGLFQSDVQRKDRLTTVSEERKKAAAWAWYQHGGGVVAPTKRISEIRERPFEENRGNKPISRFKAEAIRNYSSALDTYAKSVWDCESTLYDSYELESFSEQLHRALQGVPISALKSSLRFQGVSLLQLSSSRTQSMPHHSPSIKGPVDVQNDALYDTVNGNRYNEESHGNLDALESKSRKSVVGRPFEIITKAIRKMARSKHTPDESCIRQNRYPFHDLRHHIFHHRYRDRDREAPFRSAPSRKSLKDLFAEN